MITNRLQRTVRATVVSITVLFLSIAVFPQITTTPDGDETARPARFSPSGPKASVPDKTLTVGQSKPADLADPVVELSDKIPVSSPSRVAKQADSTSSGWQFGFAPYLYFSGLKGTVGARGRTAEIDLSAGDVLSKFDVGLMGVFEARKGRFVLVNDLIWIKLSKTVDTPGPLLSSIKVGANQFVLNPQAGYRAVESKMGSIDVLGGVRIMSIENNINFRSGILPSFDVSQRKTWATPVVGARGLANLSPKFFVNGKFDFGGGFGSGFTGQVYAGVGFRVTPRIALVGGWRYMEARYSDSSGFLFNTRMNGLVIGSMFNF